MITEYKVKLLRLVITLLITEINKLINLMLRKFRRITKMDHVPLLRKMNASTQDSQCRGLGVGWGGGFTSG